MAATVRTHFRKGKYLIGEAVRCERYVKEEDATNSYPDEKSGKQM